MKFLGVEHGTREIRFCLLPDMRYFSIPRREASFLSEGGILRRIEKEFDISLEDIDMCALTYSMGDALNKITPISRVRNRGVLSEDGAGIRTGGGAKVFDAIKSSPLKTYVICGLHRGNLPDKRLHIFSHGASPEKLGVAYHVHTLGFDSFVLSDLSSSAVTVGVADGKVVGAIDACIFAPGLMYGPLDLEAIRKVDEGIMGANEAFSHGGILNKVNDDDKIKNIASLLISMEMRAMEVLVRDWTSHKIKMVISGSYGATEDVHREVERLLGIEVKKINGRGAVIGCAKIARAIYEGVSDIMGIKVDV